MLDGSGDGKGGSFPFHRTSASVELTSQTSKCEPVMTEEQV